VNIHTHWLCFAASMAPASSDVNNLFDIIRFRIKVVICK
jgi:hypothetical protein